MSLGSDLTINFIFFIITKVYIILWILSISNIVRCIVLRVGRLVTAERAFAFLWLVGLACAPHQPLFVRSDFRSHGRETTLTLILSQDYFAL